jgi:hypothetical protein
VSLSRSLWASGRKPSRPSFDVWRTPIAEEDYRKLRADVRQVEADEGRRKDVLSSQEREEIKSLRREGAVTGQRVHVRPLRQEDGREP